MPGNFDLRNYAVTPLSSASVTVPRAQIECEVWQDGVMVRDYTGANAVAFPAILSTLTGPQRLEVLEMIVHYLIDVKAGLS